MTSLVPGQVLAPRASKEVQKGISDLNAGRLDDAQKHLEAAQKLATTNADLNYLLGFLYLQKKDPKRAQPYLMKAISIDSHHVRALTALGQLRLQGKDYAGAVTPLEQVVAVDPEYWTGHWLLSEAYLGNNDFEKSREQADLAIQKGKGAANHAEVVKGEALARLGRREEAVQALEVFLADAPNDPQGAAVRKMIAELQSTGVANSGEASARTMSALPVGISALGSPEDKLSIPSWHPPAVDDEKPPITSGVVCPAEQVIDGASMRTKELVDDVARFDATEEVLHEDLDALGRPFTKQKRRFEYIVSISEQPDGLMIEEYRGGPTNRASFPDHIATLGLPGLVLAFHPVLRDDFQMTCEGLGEWHGKPTWLVYFRQREDRRSRLMGYKLSDVTYAVSLKGRVWIAANTFQIVHLEADLLNPMPNIQLLTQHQVVDYGAVSFKSNKTQLWLPKSADLYFDFRRHRYHRRHSFDNYKLFSVDESEKIGKPKEADE